MTRTQERKPARQTLSDLRPNAQIQCINGHAAPSAGAVKFHAHQVCAECAAKLNNKEVKP